MSAPEFSRMIDPRHLVAAPVELVADEGERAALAERFGLVSIASLSATVSLVADGERVRATGTLAAQVVQPCAVTGDDLPVTIAEPLAFVFVPAQPATPSDEEVELTEAELDEIPYEGTQFDLGEAVAESLALAIDPYAEGPGADAARVAYKLSDEGPKGALAEGLAGLFRK